MSGPQDRCGPTSEITERKNEESDDVIQIVVDTFQKSIFALAKLDDKHTEMMLDIIRSQQDHTVKIVEMLANVIKKEG